MEILNDFSTSVKKAFTEIDPNWESYNGLVVCGTHDPHDIEEMLEKIRYAREDRRPFLGICAGHQYAAIEYARNVLGIKDATSEEFGQGTFVVKKLPERRTGIYPVIWRNRTTFESHWHHYALSLEYAKDFKPQWDISSTDDIVEVMQFIDHPFFMGIQFHFEYQNTRNNVHPIGREFLDTCKEYTKKYAERI